MSLTAALISLELRLGRLVGRHAAAEPYSRRYWAARYRWGGTSGKGSRGPLAAHKAAFVTRFCRENGAQTLVELGSGDGVCAARIDVPRYLGLDISEHAVALARRRARSATHRFQPIGGRDPEAIRALVTRELGGPADASLSMDVILHLVEDSVFESYMKTLAAIAGRWVIVYSGDADAHDGGGAYVRPRAYADWFQRTCPVRLIHSDGEGLAPHFEIFEKR